MPTDLIPFDIFERSGLEENYLVDVDLADVVEGAGDAEASEAFLGEIHPLTDGGRQVGNPVTVGNQSRILFKPTNQSV